MTRRLTILAAVWITIWTTFAIVAPHARPQTITTAPVAQDLNSRARGWWGRPICTPVTVIRVTIPGGLGHADPATCTVRIDPATWDGAQGWPLTYLLQDRRTTLCKVWLHEYGHLSGLPHSWGWVMAPAIEAIPTIGECNKFSRGE